MKTFSLSTVLVSVFLSVGLSYALFSHGSGLPQQQKAQQESVYDRIMRTKTLRCGYAIYKPALLRDPNSGAFSGIMHDLTEEIATQVGLNVEWVEEVGYGEMMAGLKAGRYDMICSGKWVYMPQGQEADYSLPVFITPVYPYVRTGDTRFDADIGRLNAPDFALATKDGTISADIAVKDFPQARTLAVPALADESQMLMNVVSGKADVAFLDTAVANVFLAGNPGTLRLLHPDRPQKIFETAFMYLSGEPRLAALVNGSIRQLNDSGDIDKIISKYEPTPGTLFRPARTYVLPVNFEGHAP